MTGRARMPEDANMWNEIRDIKARLGRLENPHASFGFGARVGTIKSTGWYQSDTWGDLSTFDGYPAISGPGPSVDVFIGPLRRAILMLSVQIDLVFGTSTGGVVSNNDVGYMGVQVSGASTMNPAYDRAVTSFAYQNPNPTAAEHIGSFAAMYLLDEDTETGIFPPVATPLNQGDNTFTCKFITGGSADREVLFSNPTIVVIPY